MSCDQCGGRLEHFDGESYCPDCSHFEAVEQLDQATDEALAKLAINQVEDDVGDRHGEEPPL
jgi:uncharacterized Zn finger protein (UPF0148 family)